MQKQVQTEIDEQINSIENMENNLPSSEFIQMLNHLTSENQKVLKEIKTKSAKKKEQEKAQQ